MDNDMLTIALEPEAVALYVKHLPLERNVDGKKAMLFKHSLLDQNILF